MRARTLSRRAGQATLAVLALIAFLTAWKEGQPTVRAGGPLFSGSVRWDNKNPIPFTPDQGPLGQLTNEEALELVGNLFDVWHQVGTAAISFRQEGQLAADVTANNYLGLLNAFGRQVSPIIFDADGSITDAVFGIGAKRRILGFASPHASGGRITSAMAVLNGAFVDGKSDPPDIPLDMFRGVFIHEFGHYVGLDHAQLNMDEAFDADPTNDASAPTMLPVLTTLEQSTLHLDDVIALSTLYPGESFNQVGGTIRGRVLRPDGVSGFRGANVIARHRDNPKEIATSTDRVSGLWF